MLLAVVYQMYVLFCDNGGLAVVFKVCRAAATACTGNGFINKTNPVVWIKKPLNNHCCAQKNYIYAARTTAHKRLTVEYEIYWYYQHTA